MLSGAQRRPRLTCGGQWCKSFVRLRSCALRRSWRWYGPSKMARLKGFEVAKRVHLLAEAITIENSDLWMTSFKLKHRHLKKKLRR
jgi:hypothetical protein